MSLYYRHIRSEQITVVKQINVSTPGIVAFCVCYVFDESTWTGILLASFQDVI